MKKTKKFLRMIVVSPLIFVLFMTQSSFLVNAQTVLTVDKVTLSSQEVSVQGKTPNPNDFVWAFLVKPGHNVSEIADITDTEALNSVCSYVNMTVSDETNVFEFNIGFPDNQGGYILYLKSGDASYEEVLSRTEQCKQIYVATTGSDVTGDGSESNPFATLQRAKDEVKKFKDNSNIIEINVYIRGGEYAFSNTLEFTEDDSGSENVPIIYKAYNGEKVIFHGKKELDTSKFSKITDETVRLRFDRAVENKIVEIDFSKQDVDWNTLNFTSSYMKDIWQSGEELKPMKLYFNNELQKIARWPNEGYVDTASVVDGGAARNDFIPGNDHTNGATISYTDERTDNWTGNDFFLEAFPILWHGEWIKVDSIDTVNNTIKLGYWSKHGFDSEYSRWAAVNLPEEIDIPGEWYLNSETKKLYFYPPHEITAADKVEVASFNDNFITVDNASWITFEGLQFKSNAADHNVLEYSNTGGNGIYLNNVNNITIKDCVLSDIGLHGIAGSGNNVTIEGCVVNNTGMGGIRLSGGDLNTLTPSQNKIANCDVSNVANATSTSANGAGICISGVGTRVYNNEIHNMENVAIWFSGANNIMEYNYISNAVTKTADAGAIYAGRSWISYGNIIRYNIFRDIGMQRDTSWQKASAIFLDDLFSGCEIYGNIINMNNKFSGAAIKIGGGRDNNINGNIILNSAIGVLLEDRNVDMTTLSENNMYLDLKAKAELPIYQTTFESMAANYNSLTEGKYVKCNTLKDNAYYNVGSGRSDYESMWGEIQEDSSVENTNLLYAPTSSAFVNFQAGDYRIKNSEKTGIFSLIKNSNIPDESFNLALVGIQNSAIAFNNVELMYPQNGQTDIDIKNFSLLWTKNANADYYRYYVLKDGLEVYSGETSNNSVYLGALDPCSEYVWYVEAVKDDGTIGELVAKSQESKFNTIDGFGIINLSLRDGNLIYDKYNYTNDKLNYSVIIGIYSGNKLNTVDVISESAEINTYVQRERNCEYDITNDNLEFFFWSSLESMKPMDSNFKK